MIELKFMRDNSNLNYNLLHLQDKILEIAVYINDFCRVYNIDYCLMGGSALGAKRHGGFIPWDDDFDIFMTPYNYEKFRKFFQINGDQEKFYLQEWGLTDGMITIAKLRMNQTTYIEESLKDWDIHHGIYVDIFILHNCANTRIGQLHQFLWAKYLILKGLAIRGYNRKGGIIGVLLKIIKCLPNKMWVKHGLKQVYKYKNKNTNYFCNFLGKAMFKNAIYPRECFEYTEDILFEKVLLKVPIKLHEFLVDRFGDYLKLPSPERIKQEQHAERWNTEVDFQVLIKKKFKFNDEEKLI